MAFGGKISLTGESEYKKALSQIMQQYKELTSEMKTAASQFDKNDKSTEAVTVKSQTMQAVIDKLNDKIKLQAERLNELAQTSEAQKAKIASLTTEYQTEAKTLEDLKNTLGDTSEEYKKQEKTVKELENELQKETAANNQTETAMSNLRIEMNKSQTEINNTSRDMDKLGQETEDSGKQAEKAANGGFTVLKGVLADLASSAIKSVLTGLGKIGTELVNVGKQAFNNYSEYEQLKGGIESMFGGYETGAEQINKVLGIASDAWKDLGMSENAYFQAFGQTYPLMKNDIEDQNEAIDQTNKLMQLNSDLANTFGYSMDYAANAVNWALKGSFNYIDNLQLGIKGTQEGFLQAAQSVGYMVDSVKDLTSADILDVLTKYAEKYGVIGKTADEAERTLAGSMKGVAAAWQNLLTGMGNEDADITALVNNFVDSFLKAESNILPRVQAIIKGMGTVIGELLSAIIPQLVEMVPPLLEQTLPILIGSISNLVRSVLELVPTLTPLLAEVIPQLIQIIMDELPSLISSGAELITALIKGIGDALPQFFEQLPTIIENLVDVIVDNLPMIINAGVGLIKSLLQGIMKALPSLLQKLPKIIEDIVNMIAEELPELMEAGQELMDGLIAGILVALPILLDNLPKIIETIVNGLMPLLPQIIQAGIQLIISLVKGIIDALPIIMEAIPELVRTIVQLISDNLPIVIQAGMEILTSLIEGIIDTLPDLIAEIPEIIMTIVEVLVENLPEILAMGVKIIDELIKGFGSVGERLKTKVGEVGEKIVNKFKEVPGKVTEIGRKMVENLWDGIKNAGNWIKNKLQEWGEGILGGIKEFFGINSPSALFREQVGENLAKGIGVGFEDEMQNVAADMQDAIPQSFDVSGSITGAATAQTDNMVLAFMDALGRMKIELDDEVAGQFVEKTVTRAVFA